MATIDAIMSTPTRHAIHITEVKKKSGCAEAIAMLPDSKDIGVDIIQVF